MWGSQEKKLGQKVNVEYFRVDPYTLGNRITRAFQNLSDIRVRCHCEIFWGESLYMLGSQEKNKLEFIATLFFTFYHFEQPLVSWRLPLL